MAEVAAAERLAEAKEAPAEMRREKMQVKEEINAVKTVLDSSAGAVERLATATEARLAKQDIVAHATSTSSRCSS